MEHSRCREIPVEKSWDSYSKGGMRWARKQEVDWLDELLTTREWREEDLATVLAHNGLLEGVFDSREGWRLRMEWLRSTLGTIISNYWNPEKAVSLMVALNLSERSVIELRNMLGKRS